MPTRSDKQPATQAIDPFAVGAAFDHRTEPRIARIVGVTPEQRIIYDCNEFDDEAGRWVCIQKNFMRPRDAFLADYHPAPEGA